MSIVEYVNKALAIFESSVQDKNAVSKDDVQKVLNAIRVQFNVETVYLCCMNAANNGVVCVNVSTSNPNFVSEGFEQKLLESKVCEFGFAYADDVVSEKIQPVVFHKAAKSVLHFGMMRDKELDGSLGMIDSKNEQRVWTEEERGILKKIGNMLQNYVLSERLHEAQMQNGVNFGQNVELIGELATEYTVLFRIDIESDEFEVCSFNEKAANIVKPLLERNTDFSTLKREYIKAFVHPDDRKNIAAFMKYDAISKELSHKRASSFRYRQVCCKQVCWLEVTLVKVGDVVENPSRVIVGISIKNDEVSREREQLNHDFTLLTALYADTAQLFKIDTDSGCYDVFSNGDDDFMDDVIKERHGSNFYENLILKVSTFIHPSDKEDFLTAFSLDYLKHIIATGVSKSVNARWLDGGEFLWKTSKIVRMYDSNGKAYVLVGIMDSNEEYERQQELQKNLKIIEEQKEQLERNMEMIGGLALSYTILYRVNMESDSYEVFSFNDETSNIVRNYIKKNSLFSQMIREYADNLVHPEDREKLNTFVSAGFIRSELLHKKSCSMLFRRLVGDEYQWIEVNIVKFDFGDEVPTKIAVGFTYKDEEVRKKQEQQEALECALAMSQAANRAKTTFLNNMSHDIRTPMNAIIGFTGLAQRHIDSKEHVLDYLAKIGQSSGHLLALINDVLDMSRIESGKMTLNKKRECFSEIIHTLENIVQADVRAKNLSFGIYCENMKNENIVCDKLRLNQVLLNVLSNAIKYTQSGGNISLRIIEHETNKSGFGKFEFRIKDNGIGMDENFLKMIYEPFTRVNSSTVSGIQGTGLGMSITKNIVNMMDGKIDVLSKENCGTEVILNFEFELASSEADDFDLSLVKGIRCLVVDDDMGICENAERMLNEIGVDCCVCGSGEVAIEKAEAAIQAGNPFQVYIVDWVMPGMSGLETARRIRTFAGTNVKIFVLTAYDYSDISEDAKKIGVADFIAKPMFPSDLKNTLCRSFDTKRCKKVVSDTVKYNFSGKKILLAEDNEFNREIATELLQDVGFKVCYANDGDVAVRMIREQPDFDLVLMDVQMPKMNGYDAAKAIRTFSDKKIAKIPIIAMTANAFEEDRNAALEAGMNDHIAKPIDMDKMRSVLQRYLSA